MNKRVIIILLCLVTCVSFYNYKNFNNKFNLKEINYKILLEGNNGFEVMDDTQQLVVNVTGLVGYDEINIKKSDINEFDIETMEIDDIEDKVLREFYQVGINNTNILQSAIDYVSDNGGGKVLISSGTFYFTASRGRYHEKEKTHYIIKCRNNVLVEGSGMDETILKPFGSFERSVNMFAHVESNDTGKIYIENADFKKFTIDGELTNLKGNYFAAGGKGFMLSPIKDCDWEFVKVMNTDATGFGVDLPINCTIKNCIAIGNGKAADETKNGASGFGIGTGYADNESMYIKDCLSIGNRKYGFFFEHQGRFNSYTNSSRIADGYNEDTGISGFVVEDSVASGNMYNFGGEKGNDVTYKNCTSKISKSDDPNPLGNTNKVGFNFGLDTRRIYLENVLIEYDGYEDVPSEYSDVIDWAVNKMVISSNSDNFKYDDLLTRKQAITFLWRMAERPGDVLLGDEEVITGFSDIANCNWRNCSYYEAAVEWGVKNDILDVSSELFNPNNTCNNANFILMLWRYAGAKKVDIDNGFVVNDTIKKWHIEALNWALSIGLIDRDFELKDNYKKIEALELLYIYYNLQSKNVVFDESLSLESDVNNEKYMIVKDNFIDVFDLLGKVTINELNRSIDVYSINKVKKNNEAIVVTGDRLNIYRKSNNLSIRNRNYILLILGDVNSDGLVDKNDTDKLYDSVKNVTSFEEMYKKSGDVTGDGKIKINDVAKVYQYSKEKINNLG